MSKSRQSLITKLKYVQAHTEHLSIWSGTDHCLVVYHCSLIIEQSDNLEKIQMSFLENLYSTALEKCWLKTTLLPWLCLENKNHQNNHWLLPLNKTQPRYKLRSMEKIWSKLCKNFSLPENYSAIFSQVDDCKLMNN